MTKSERASKNTNVFSDEEDAFSAEETPPSSSSSSPDSEDERRRKQNRKSSKKKKKRRDNSSDVDDPSSSEDESSRKRRRSGSSSFHHRTKKKSKYYHSSESEGETFSAKKAREVRKVAFEAERKRKAEEEKKKLERLKNSKLQIVPLTDEEIKEQYRYKKHKCALSDVPTTRAIAGQDLCRPGRPADLSIEKVKLHYVVHYIYRGTWDHIVPEEGELEGKIDSYICNACTNKRFKNYLEKREYPGRGSSLCHLATDHGRLLHAMLTDDKVDMIEEIKALAKYDKQFNEAYRAYLDHDDNSFGLPDDEIITIKESLVWKIYVPKEKAGGSQKKVKSSTSGRTGNSVKLDSEEKKFLQSVMDRERPKNFRCPFKEELDCDFKGTEDGQAFRLHFFLHFKESWSDRIDSLTKGDKCYYCDLCPTKKPIKGATEEGAKTATICHLAIQHHELRKYMEKDDRISKEFVSDVYYDVDLKKAQNAGLQPGVKPDSDSAPEDEKSDEENENKSDFSDEKSSKSYDKTPKVGPRSKTRPVPKSRMKQTEPETEIDNEDIPDFSSSDDESKKRKETAAVQPIKSKNSVKKPGPKSAKKASLFDRTNTHYVRKRPKMSLTLEDLEDGDGSEDENWSSSKKESATFGKPKSKTLDKITASEGRTRAMPRRKVTQKPIKQTSFSDEDSDH